MENVETESYLNGKHCAGLLHVLRIVAQRAAEHFADVIKVDISRHNFGLVLFDEGHKVIELLVIAAEQGVDQIGGLVRPGRSAQILLLELQQRLVVVVRSRQTVQQLREKRRTTPPRRHNQYSLIAPFISNAIQTIQQLLADPPYSYNSQI